jgi:hypothetical protein
MKPATVIRGLFGALAAAWVVTSLAPASLSYADTLKDVLGSRTLKTVERATERSRKHRDGNGRLELSWYNGMDPQSNFALIWTGNGANLLFSWIGANLPQYKLINTHSKRYRELVRAEGIIMDRNRVAVRLEIVIPHPTYRDMVKYKTLKQFNQYEPPILQAVAQEPIEVNKRQAMYYRANKGGCSVLVKIAQLGIVNLSVPRCEQSSVMMQIANDLDYTRLDKKLST